MIIILDDFYENPDEVRKQALSQYFHTGKKGLKNYFPGKRTVGKLDSANHIYCKNRFEKLLNRKIIYFPDGISNGAFTLGLRDKIPLDNWVHHDNSNVLGVTEKEMGGKAFAAVIYLSPNPPQKTGTGLFSAKQNGLHYAVPDLMYSEGAGFNDLWDEKHSPFTIHTYAENKYNRLIMYPAIFWHAPINAGWGYDKETGRLVQIFFFVAENE